MRPWYTPISEELERVDSIMNDALLISNSELREMYHNITSSGGKKIRPAICILSHFACGGNDERILDVASAFELIHNATLIHDDINDKSDIRRGRKTLHKEYTVSKAIILGDLLFAIGFRLVGTCASDVIDTVVNASEAMAESEFLQKDFEHVPDVSEEVHLDIIRGKTAMPICAAARVGAALAKAENNTVKKISDYAMNVGLAFQIIDDLLDITGNETAMGKKIGSDILEGKPTLPLIYAMQDSTYGKQIKEIFKKSDLNDKDIEKAISMIRETDVEERCIRKAKGFVDAAVQSISGIRESEYKDALIALSGFVVMRDR